MNALLLKVDLVARGLVLDGAAEAPDGGRGGEAPAVDLTLPGGLMASVPIVAGAASAPDYRLVTNAGGTYLERDPEAAAPPPRIEVTPAPTPRFYAARTTRGMPMHRVAERRGRVLVVTPLGRCGYSIAGRPCTFCIEGGRPAQSVAGAATPADVIEVLAAASREAPLDIVLFNLDSAEGEDGGMAFLAPYVQAVRRHAAVLVAAQVHPPRTAAWVDRSYALGLDAVSYSLEIFDADAFSRLCVGRARYLGRDRYLEMLARAAAIFPRGAVWSELVLGVEPPECTAAGIDALAELGVVPVLAIPRGPSGGGHRVRGETTTDLFARLADAVTARRIPATWIRDLGASITPADVRHAAGRERGMLAAARTGLARRSARTLSRVRRRLRVRTADDAAPGH